MIREFGLSIKFRWSGGGGKRFVRGLGRAENKINWLSETSDEQKTEKKWLSEASDEQETRKNSFPRPRMSRKQEKMAFRGLG